MGLQNKSNERSATRIECKDIHNNNQGRKSIKPVVE